MRKIFRKIVQLCRLMIGIPDYETYVRHRKICHADTPVMSFEEFFIERQENRYSGKKPGRCC